MAIYDPKDYEKVINRIQEKVNALHINMGACLSEEAIAAFEACHKVQLPQAYRLFCRRLAMDANMCLMSWRAVPVKSWQSHLCWIPSGSGRTTTERKSLSRLTWKIRFTGEYRAGGQRLRHELSSDYHGQMPRRSLEFCGRGRPALL